MSDDSQEALNALKEQIDSLSVEAKEALLQACQQRPSSKPAGRRKGSGIDHSAALRRMAELQTDNPKISDRQAAEIASKKHPASEETLRKAYRPHKSKLLAEAARIKRDRERPIPIARRLNIDDISEALTAYERQVVRPAQEAIRAAFDESVKQAAAIAGAVDVSSAVKHYEAIEKEMRKRIAEEAASMADLFRAYEKASGIYPSLSKLLGKK